MPPHVNPAGLNACSQSRTFWVEASLPSVLRLRGMLEFSRIVPPQECRSRFSGVRGFPAWWLARTYHMSQIPGVARKARAVIDWTASLPFRRDLSELGSIGHPRPLEATMEPWHTSSSPSPSASPRG